MKPLLFLLGLLASISVLRATEEPILYLTQRDQVSLNRISDRCKDILRALRNDRELLAGSLVPKLTRTMRSLNSPIWNQWARQIERRLRRGTRAQFSELIDEVEEMASTQVNLHRSYLNLRRHSNAILERMELLDPHLEERRLQGALRRFLDEELRFPNYRKSLRLPVPQLQDENR